MPEVPPYRREAYSRIYDAVTARKRMVVVTGPRRVGKSTLLKQVIHGLIANQALTPGQYPSILYFSMDDPALKMPGFNTDQFMNDLAQAMAARSAVSPAYVFLDEVQRFPYWELYLKKFFDLQLPVQFVVSGSASSPIFKKSKESLLGRVDSFRVQPFSFSEWTNAKLALQDRANALMVGDVMLLCAAEDFALRRITIDAFIERANSLCGRSDLSPLPINDYFFEGGFPEVWDMDSLTQMQEYLYQHQVEKVLYEDLVSVADVRAPDLLRRFYLGLLNDPGRETNLSRLSSDLAIKRSTIEAHLPLLEATDLVWRMDKFSGVRSTPKAGNFKTYLLDVAVRNAVLKISKETLIADPGTLGHYAENVLANHLRLWPGLIDMGYFRERDREMDFVIDLGAHRLAVECKYREQQDFREIMRLIGIAESLKCEALVLVTKNPLPSGLRDDVCAASGLRFAAVPLSSFLMLF